jgi:hypothetical protein
VKPALVAPVAPVAVAVVVAAGVAEFDLILFFTQLYPL